MDSNEYNLIDIGIPEVYDMNKFDMDITAKRLKERRKELDLTQSVVAERTCITPQALSTYENGSIPRMDILWPLADALECEPDYILGRIKYPKRTTSEIAEKVPLSREAIESLEELSWAIKAYSDFDSILISRIISDLIIYLVNELSITANMDTEKGTFKEGLFDDLVGMQLGYEYYSSEVGDKSNQRYPKLVIRGTKTSIGDKLSDCVSETIRKIALDEKGK